MLIIKSQITIQFFNTKKNTFNKTRLSCTLPLAVRWCRRETEAVSTAINEAVRFPVLAVRCCTHGKEAVPTAINLVFPTCVRHVSSRLIYPHSFHSSFIRLENFCWQVNEGEMWWNVCDGGVVSRRIMQWRFRNTVVSTSLLKHQWIYSNIYIYNIYTLYSDQFMLRFPYKLRNLFRNR